GRSSLACGLSIRIAHARSDRTKKPRTFRSTALRSAEREGLPKTAFPEGGGFDREAELASLARLFHWHLRSCKHGSVPMKKPRIFQIHGFSIGGEGGIRTPVTRR